MRASKLWHQIKAKVANVKSRPTRQKSLRVPLNLFKLRLLGGEMAEWFKAHAWKACVPKKYRGFESLSLRQFLAVAAGR